MGDGVADGDHKFVAIGVALLVTSAAALGILLATRPSGSYPELVRENLAESIGFMVSVQFVLAVPIIFVLEHRYPARREQTGLDSNVVVDAFYMLVSLPIVAATVTFIVAPLDDILDERAGWLVVDGTRGLPLWLAAGVGLVIGDFWVWLAHLLKHKVPLFWRFHTVHHSQPRISLFTANRTHPVDALFEHLTLLVPVFIFVPSITEQSGAVFLLVFVTGWYTRFQHANIRTNLGPLRYVFVTPQSHRIHHSTAPEHWDSNYATIFAWDRLFGTQHPDDTSYPPTGLDGIDVPVSTRLTLRDMSASLAGQMVFPFVSSTDGSSTHLRRRAIRRSRAVTDSRAPSRSAMTGRPSRSSRDGDPDALRRQVG